MSSDEAVSSPAPITVAPERVAFETSGKPTKKVGPTFIVLYLLTMFGISMAINLPSTVTIALRVATIDPTHKDTAYSLISGFGTIIGTLAMPFFGRLSDRTRSRFGRRRPWILGGLVAAALGAAVIAFTDTLPMLIVGWFIMQASINACLAACVAIVADSVPEKHQGIVGSFVGLDSSAAIVVGVYIIQAFPTQVLIQIGLPAAVALALGVLLVFFYRADKPATGPKTPFGFKEFITSFWVSPRQAPDFAKLWITLFLIGCTGAAVGTFMVYYVQSRLHVSAAEFGNTLALVYLIPGILTVVLTPMTGWIGDKLRRRKPLVYIAIVSAVVGVALIITTTTTWQYLVGVILLNGISTSLLLGSYVPLSIATMPDKETAGRSLGVTYMATNLAWAAVPLAAPLLLNLGDGSNYQLLFIVAGVLGALAVIPLAMIKKAR